MDGLKSLEIMAKEVEARKKLASDLSNKAWNMLLLQSEARMELIRRLTARLEELR